MDEQPVPRILTRQEHPLSARLIDPDALKILYRLHDHGFQACLVGGCVRDLLLGKIPKDFDVATDAHPQQIRELFRNSRLIGRRFRLAHIFFKDNKFIEVSTFRRRSEFEAAGEPDPSRSDNTFGTPAEDAFRRDITINGIFYNIADFSLIDYVGGLEDLRQKMIRCIGDPEEKFTGDPVRMIRVIRHAARTGFAIEEQTYRSLTRHVDKLRLCSPSRVREEFTRELREGPVQESMKMMLDSGMLFALFPPFSRPLAEAGPKEYFIRIITTIDDLRSAGKVPSEEFCLALFLLPSLGFYCPSGRFPPGRRGQALFQQQVREWVTETMRPLHFARQVREAVIHLLSAQRIFKEFLLQRKLPWRFKRQPYFSQALHLFEMEARARGEESVAFSWTSGPGGPIGQRRKKKRRRKRKRPPLSAKKPQENRMPNLLEIPHP
jgi:poly(A) polymerase